MDNVNLQQEILKDLLVLNLWRSSGRHKFIFNRLIFNGIVKQYKIICLFQGSLQKFKKCPFQKITLILQQMLISELEQFVAFFRDDLFFSPVKKVISFLNKYDNL
eukprot:TRINITY_DN5061_c0_g1_i2.p3 TRINITY_DN5061_c0_g1~~TRINITY_DN5061_c0_g1_i2.p3  ORF type:complete len:105 (-),score=3.81 TRINITY_DN5061_c0_g1_i2:498-812(-)